MAAAFRVGFKASAERIAIELRDELELGPFRRLDPAALARHLCIPVQTLAELADAAPEEVRYFLGCGRAVFSAVTIYLGPHRRAIITNPAHANTRQMNSLCHELSHILLEHEPEMPLQPGGGRRWDAVQEREADWLAGCLLIPQQAAHQAARDGRSDQQVATQYGVSLPLASWRMNSTGARIRAQRLDRFRGANRFAR